MVRRAAPGAARDALAIALEAAKWGIDRGLDVWEPAELTEDTFSAAALADELVMGYAADTPVATMLLQSSDPFYWPDAPPRSALYLHKVAVSRAFAGQGWLSRLVEFAVSDARARGVTRLRLDTILRPKLQELYERHGFSLVKEEPWLVGRHRIIRMERNA